MGLPALLIIEVPPLDVILRLFEARLERAPLVE